MAQGAASPADCTIEPTSIQARFTLVRNRTLLSQPLHTATENMEMDACLQACAADGLCASVLFVEVCAEDNTGTCTLFADSLATALSTQIRYSAWGC